ncbi:hypothetical protein LJY25_10720 [Hymenobacter sp. BT175]|uniref:hypothetical protein n=1 Tax=Hymenobacter translucens TaxID=2886507 RepID=UPI001D0EC408|nr:hypothetical protein [Hymenobacter translucens]MCC2546918.1 hypothetical protein [Hymenobacter translucens]
MRTTLLLALPVALLAACSAPDSSRNEEAPTTTAPPAPVAVEPLDTAGASQVDAHSDTLKTVRRRHVFSSPGTPDLFTLQLRGPSVLEGEATFTITDHAGQVIFREALPAADLEAALVYELKTPSATPAQREAFIRRRMDSFFADQNFHRPAISPGEAYRNGELERPTWDDLKQRADAVSFEYLVGKEERRRIAWSPLKKQVVRLGSFGG